MEDTECPPNVRVDVSMDRSVSVSPDGPEAAATEQAVVGDGPEVYKVGPHLCHLTAGATRIT
eukprot:3051082-Amphidinium_carterae.1